MNGFHGHLLHLYPKRVTQGLKMPNYRVILFWFFLKVQYRLFLINKKGILHPFQFIEILGRGGPEIKW